MTRVAGAGDRRRHVRGGRDLGDFRTLDRFVRWVEFELSTVNAVVDRGHERQAEPGTQPNGQ